MGSPPPLSWLVSDSGPNKVLQSPVIVPVRGQQCLYVLLASLTCIVKVGAAPAEARPSIEISSRSRTLRQRADAHSDASRILFCSALFSFARSVSQAGMNSSRSSSVSGVAASSCGSRVSLIRPRPNVRNLPCLGVDGSGLELLSFRFPTHRLCFQRHGVTGEGQL